MLEHKEIPLKDMKNPEKDKLLKTLRKNLLVKRGAIWCELDDETEIMLGESSYTDQYSIYKLKPNCVCMNNPENLIIEFLKTNRVQYKHWTEEEKRVANNIPRKFWGVVITEFDVAPLKDQINPNVKLGDHRNPDEVYVLDKDYEAPSSNWSVCGVNFYNARLVLSDNKLPVRQYGPYFGGLKYKDCECNLLKDQPEFLMTPPQPCEIHGPFNPTHVRLWRK